MASFGALQGIDLILYTAAFWFRKKSALTNNAFRSWSLTSHNPVMRQVRLIYPWNWGKHRHRRMKEMN